jgi:hypothetical protein
VTPLPASNIHVAVPHCPRLPEDGPRDGLCVVPCHRRLLAGNSLRWPGANPTSIHVQLLVPSGDRHTEARVSSDVFGFICQFSSRAGVMGHFDPAHERF